MVFKLNNKAVTIKFIVLDFCAPFSTKIRFFKVNHITMYQEQTSTAQGKQTVQKQNLKASPQQMLLKTQVRVSKTSIFISNIYCDTWIKQGNTKYYQSKLFLPDEHLPFHHWWISILPWLCLLKTTNMHLFYAKKKKILFLDEKGQHVLKHSWNNWNKKSKVSIPNLLTQVKIIWKKFEMKSHHPIYFS